MGATPETTVDQGREGRARRFDSLEEAFLAYGTPPLNQALVRAIVDGLDVTGFVGYRTYFRIERRGSAALEVHPGFTNGFRSEADAARLAGGAERWPSRRFHGAWGVTHPETGRRTAPAARRSSASKASGSAAPRRAAAPEKAPEICPTCFMVLPATGICANCAA